MDQTEAVLIAASIGAGGAVLAQVAASTVAYYASKRQAERREAHERTSRFTEDRRQLFARYLLRYSMFGSRLRDGLPYSTDEHYRVIQSDWVRTWEEIGLLEQEISLVAPALWHKMHSLRRTAQDLLSSAKPTNGVGPTAVDANRYFQAIQACRAAMAAELGAVMPAEDAM